MNRPPNVACHVLMFHFHGQGRYSPRGRPQILHFCLHVLQTLKMNRTHLLAPLTHCGCWYSEDRRIHDLTIFSFLFEGEVCFFLLVQGASNRLGRDRNAMNHDSMTHRADKQRQFSHQSLGLATSQTQTWVHSLTTTIRLFPPRLDPLRRPWSYLK